MDKLHQFSADVTPALTMIDPSGRRNPVATAELAHLAISLVNDLQAIGGTDKSVRLTAHSDFQGEPNELEDATVLLYYRPHAGRATKSEIAKVSRHIAWCNVEISDGRGNDAVRVRGARAIVHPEMLKYGADAVPFLVSTTVWFNKNRSTSNFPANADHMVLLLADINARISELGAVSAAN